MNSILITGGAGFIGSHLAEKLSDEYNVIVVDNLLTGHKKFIQDKKNIFFIKADVNNYDDIAPIFYKYNFKYVFHYAAVVGVKRTLDNPLLVLRDIKGIENVLHLCKSTNVERILFSSSSEVYGEPVETPQNEEITPLNARLPYALTKSIGESFIRSYRQEHGLNFTIFRFFNTFGERQSTDFVMSKFINCALNNKDIKIYGQGTQTRSFNYIQNNVELCCNALKTNRAIDKIINVGDIYEISIIDLAKIIKHYTNSKSNIIHVDPLKEGDMSRRNPDITLMKDILVLQHYWNFEKGLEQTINYFAKYNI